MCGSRAVVVMSYLFANKDSKNPLTTSDNHEMSHSIQIHTCKYVMSRKVM